MRPDPHVGHTRQLAPSAPQAVTRKPPAHVGVVEGLATQPVQQLPDTQRPPVQMARLATGAPSRQTGLPLAQSMTPLRHALGLLVQA